MDQNEEVSGVRLIESFTENFKVTHVDKDNCSLTTTWMSLTDRYNVTRIFVGINLSRKPFRVILLAFNVFKLTFNNIFVNRK